MANKYVFKFLILFMFLGFFTRAQINPPTVGFSAACGSSSFYTFNANFSFVFAPLPGNVFTVEMSNDDFNTILQVGSNSTILTSPATISFNLTSGFAGAENYRIRIKSSSPAFTSPPSVAFPAHYLIHNQPIILNTESIGNNVNSCNSSYTISIDNTGTSSSPLYYNYLKYKWYKVQPLPASDLLVQASSNVSSYTVTSPGQYYVKTDYGSCDVSSTSKSSLVTVSFTTSTSLNISSSNGSTICTGDTTTLSGNLPVVNTYSYQWFQNTILISGATNNSYVANNLGTYVLQINTGSCVISGSIDLTPSPITASLNLISPSNLNAGQSLSLIVSTTANSPTYQWFSVNGGISTLLTETSNTLLVNQAGIYKVNVTQNTGCNTTKTLQIEIRSGTGSGRDELPNLISPDNDGVNDKWVLPSYITSQAQEIKVEILNEYGKQVFITDNYQNDWPDSDAVIPKTNPVFYFIISAKDQILKQGTITVIK